MVYMTVKSFFGWFAAGTVAILITIALTTGVVTGCKSFQRYQLREDAKNDLIRAESQKKIKTQEAIATELSAVHLKEAEIIRSRGVAKANKIIAGSITPGYLRWYYIS